jgi:hypothetical protein
MEENNTLSATAIADVCIPESCYANIPYRINAHIIYPSTNRRQLCIAQCILTSYFPLHRNVRCVLSNNFKYQHTALLCDDTLVTFRCRYAGNILNNVTEASIVRHQDCKSLTQEHG